MKENNWPHLSSVWEKADRIAESIKDKDICPKYEDLFKAFELTSLQDTKVVIIGDEPSCNDEATGLSYTTKSGKVTPTNRVILNSLRKSELISERLDTADFSKWALQGVLMLNLVLSTERDYIRKHYNVGWEEVTKRILLELIFKEDPVVFMLWGKEIRGSVMPLFSVEPARIRPHHLVLMNVHPLAEIYGVEKFSDKGDFKTANDWLIAHEKTPIQWDTL
jgi:uracil-DNA glycosylase